MNSSGGLEIVFEKLRFCDGEYAYRRSKAVFSNFSDVAWTLPERNQEDEGLVRCASLQFFVRHYSHCGPNNWTSVIKLHPFLKARFVTEENTFNHVFPIHDLVLFSWTGTQKCIKRPKKKKKQLSNDRPPRKQTILNLYPFVYQYKFTLVLTARQLWPCTFSLTCFQSWQLDVSLVLLNFFQFYLLHGEPKLYYDNCRCSCPCIA